ncbi:hypothetical protein PO124_11135 [Bacillus licheniformis]|nr:hypothetical protein [Bacillus licheniformis]
MEDACFAASAYLAACGVSAAPFRHHCRRPNLTRTARKFTAICLMAAL